MPVQAKLLKYLHPFEPGTGSRTPARGWLYLSPSPDCSDGNGTVHCHKLAEPAVEL